MKRNLLSILIGVLIGLPLSLYATKDWYKPAEQPKEILSIKLESEIVCAAESAVVDVPPENPYGELVAVESTSYCESGLTADESMTRLGIAAAKREWIGKTVILYENDNGAPGDLLGIWEIKDTGGDYRIKNGTCIDVWLPTYEESIQWGRKQVFMQLIDAQG